MLLSSQPSQTGTGYPKCCQPVGLALDAAATLVLSDDCLDILGAGAASFVLAGISVESVRFEVATLEVDQSFEAHYKSGARSVLEANTI